MYKNIKNITLSLLIIMSIFSCTEEDKFNNPTHFGLENGAFARFKTASPSETILLSEFKENGYVSDQIIDSNDNISEYSLTMIANVNGTLTTIEDFKTFNSFPANVEITAQDIADALEISTLNINYGDSFKFVAKAIREDGVVFTGESPAYDAGETTITGDEVITGGNTESTLNNPSTGYHSAMNFNFIIACDAFDPSVVAGTYNVVQTTNFFGETNTVREVIAGPDVNQITIIGGEYPSSGGEDLILTITPNGVMVEGGYNDGLAAPDGLPGITYVIHKAIVLPCIDKIDVNLDFSYPYTANDHKFVLVRQ